MAGFEHEACLVDNRRATGIEHVGFDVRDGATFLAQQVKISVVTEVINGPSMTEVDVIDDAEFGQSVERSVDGRFVHGRMLFADVRRQIVGSRVIPAGYQRLDHGPSGLGESAPGTLQSRQDVIEGRACHVGDGTRLRFLAWRSRGDGS